MKTVCEKDMCTGCHLCFDICPKKAIEIRDTGFQLNAVMGEACVDCGACKGKCPQNTNVNKNKYRFMKQGWAEDDKIRRDSSSGGVATALIKSFLERDGVVCSCIFDQGNFTFMITEDAAKYGAFKGSKYVKSDPSGMYRKIKEYLQNGRKVLMVALPCQIAAAKMYLGERYGEQFYTVDLICHGTPSKELLDSYLKECGVDIDGSDSISFRNGIKYGLSVNHKRLEPVGVVDLYLLSFLCSTIFTENCYHCRYASTERVSDLTLGDSWDNTFPAAEKQKGISLILCQTEKGKTLLDNAKLELFDVDESRVLSSQAQLRSPSQKDKKREKFIMTYQNDHFMTAARRTFRYKWFKQRIKKILILMGLLRP